MVQPLNFIQELMNIPCWVSHSKIFFKGQVVSFRKGGEIDPYSLVGMEDGAAIRENILSVPLEVKHRVNYITQQFYLIGKQLYFNF